MLHLLLRQLADEQTPMSDWIRYADGEVIVDTNDIVMYLIPDKHPESYRDKTKEELRVYWNKYEGTKEDRLKSYELIRAIKGDATCLFWDRTLVFERTRWALVTAEYVFLGYLYRLSQDPIWYMDVGFQILKGDKIVLCSHRLQSPGSLGLEAVKEMMMHEVLGFIHAIKST
jgi:hypothetical protein